MSMSCVIALNVLGFFGGCGRCPWCRMLSVVRRRITPLAKCRVWFLSSGFEFSVSPGTVKSAGCVVLFHPPLSLVASWTDSDGRYLHLEFSLRGFRFRVACIYAPSRNPGQDLFLTYVADNLALGILLSWLATLIPSLIDPWTAVVL